MSRGWRGGRENRSHSDSTESPAWKQSRRRAANAGGGHRWGLIAFASLMLIILVGVAIWIFVIPDRYATSFSVVNVQSPAGSQEAIQLQWPGLVNQKSEIEEFTADNAVLRNLKSDSSGSQLIDRWGEGLNSVREDARFREKDFEILILCLQTSLVNSSAGKLQVLTGRGSPDLESEDAISLDSVKEGISRLVDERPNVSVLLLIDTPPLRDSLRYGSTGNGGIAECLKWPDDIDNLAVIAACTDQEISWPGSVHFEGQTAFSHFVRAAISKEADTNKDELIHVSEFFECLTAKTQDWVKNQRGSELQHVTISDKYSDFVVVKTPRQLADQKLLSVVDDAALRRLEAAWKHGQQINDRCGARFAPIPFRVALDYLLAAEESFLAGDFETSNALCGIAEKVYLSATDAELKAQPGSDIQSRADLSSDGQLPRTWFQSTPAFPRISSSWSDPAPEATSPSEAAPLLTWEQVLQAEINARTNDSEQRKKFLIDQRLRAEQTAAHTFGSVHILDRLLTKTDTEILDVEDSFFVSPDADPEVTGAIEPVLRAVAETARERRQAESLLADIQPQIPGLLDWCSTAAPADKDSDAASILDDIFERKETGSLWDRVPARLQSPGSAQQEELNRELASETLRLLLCTRTLQQLLFQTPAPDSLSSLQEHQAALIRWRTRLDETYSQANSLTRLLVANAIGEDRKKAVPGSALQSHYHATRRLLNLTFLPAEDRIAILRMVAATDMELSKGTDHAEETETGIRPCMAAPGSMSAVRWKAQMLTYLPQEQVKARTMEDLRDHGYELSDVWKTVRRDLMTPPDDSTTTQELGNREFLSRILPVYDCMLVWDKRKNLLTKAHFERYQHEYRDLHVKRLLTGGWVTGTSPDWYLKTAGKWAADDLVCQDKLKKASDANWAASLKLPLARSVVKLTNGRKWAGQGLIEFPSPKLFQGKAAFRVAPTGSERIPPGLHLMSAGTSVGDFFAPVVVGQDSSPVPGFEFKVTQTAAESDLSQPLDYGVSLYFRGRNQSLGVIQIDPREGRSWEVVRTMPSEHGAIYLETTDTRPIAFVFDWSGSMTASLGNNQITRAAEALAAMRKLIALQDPFCPASLRAFGHRRGLASPNPDFPTYFRGFQFPDQSIEPPEDPQKDSQQLVPLTRLNAAGQTAFQDVLKRLENSKPFGATPLLYSLCRAITQDLQYQPGVIVAITDGVATDMENLDELVQLLKGSNGKINVLVIMFDINPKEQASITQLFGTEGLKERCTVKSALDIEGIIKALDDFRKAPVFTLDDPSAPVHIEATKDQNRFQYLHDELPTATSYQLVYQDVKTRDNIPLVFAAGDTQRLQVDWRSNEFLFIRPPSVAAADLVGETDDPFAPTQLSAISTAKRNGGDGTLEVELILTGADSSLPVKAPEEVEFWFEADSDPGQQFHRTEQRLPRDSGGMLIGTPAWKIRLKNWPRSNVRVHAVCRMTRTMPDHVFKWSDIAMANGPDNLINHPATGPLPAADIWYRILPGKLQIRLDVPDGNDKSAKELPDVRIEIGKRDATNREFYPDRVNSVCRRFESGSVVWEFEGDWTDDKLAEREVALTSRYSRQNGALVVKQALSVPTEIINP